MIYPVLVAYADNREDVYGIVPDMTLTVTCKIKILKYVHVTYSVACYLFYLSHCKSIFAPIFVMNDHKVCHNFIR